jgi:hypothetical protein
MEQEKVETIIFVRILLIILEKIRNASSTKIKLMSVRGEEGARARALWTEVEKGVSKRIFPSCFGFLQRNLVTLYELS